MNKLTSYILINGTSFGILIWAGISGSSFAHGLWTATSMITLIMSVICGLVTLGPWADTLLPAMAKQDTFEIPTRSVPLKVDIMLDLVTFLVCFAFEFYFTAGIWLFLTFFGNAFVSKMFDPNSFIQPENKDSF
jgi:hypothetical protein